MKLPAACIRSALVSMALIGCTVSFALPPDPRLLSLVPPASQIVAGAVAPLEDSHRDNFLVFTRANTLDIEDFFSLVGADASREIRQVIFAASAGRDGAPPEHSLLVIGHFDSDRLYRSASTTSIASNYHGVDLLVVHPLERERAILTDDRWFAIVNSRLAIFGTVLSVKEEIDRYLSRAAPDVSIVQKLNQLQNQNETWCLISSLSLEVGIPRVLRNLDSAFADIEPESDTLLFGMKYGRQIEFEYVIHPSPDPQAVLVPRRPNTRMVTSAGHELFLNPDSRVLPGNRRVVKISRARYEKWLANLTRH